MNTTNNKRSVEVTPVFGLTKSELMPIVEEAAGEAVASFDIRMEHPRPKPYGFAAEKEIPTFDYVTKTGREGSITVFAKRFHRTGDAEAAQYRFLQAHEAPIARMYGSLTDPQGREILFVEYVEVCIPIGTMREVLSLVARFNAIRPSPEYAAWLRERPHATLQFELAVIQTALERIWECARTGTLGEHLRQFCSPQARLRQLRSAVRQVIDRTREMPSGLVHTDFSRENTGRRRPGELLVLDVEWVTIGPRFFDVAGWIAWPPYQPSPGLRSVELARHYLDEYARWGGTPPSLETFIEDIRLLSLTGRVRYFDFILGRALGGSAGQPAADDERRDSCDELYRTLTLLLSQYLLRGTEFSALHR